MKSVLARFLASAVLAFGGLFVAPTHAAPLVLQAPSYGIDAAANGNLDWTTRMAEVFSFSGTGQTLSWWGTHQTGLNVDLWAGDQNAAVFSATGVPASIALGPVVAAADGSIVIDGVPVDVFRYSVSLGGLAGGTYTLAIDGFDDDRPADLIWFWLHGLQGDGHSLTNVGDAGVQVNGFDLALRVEGERNGSVPEPGSLMLVVLALAAFWTLRAARQG